MEGFYFDHALLISCIDGLGRFNERLGVYEKDLDTVNCLKDIDRFLRRDFEDSKQALLTMGKCNVVSQNLLPLLKTYPADSDIVYHAMRVLVLMSMPPQDLYPTNVKDIHQAIKADFLDSDALGILLSMCHEPLRHLDDLTDSQYKILQMFITFVRNMMIIPDSTEVAASTTKNHHSTLQVDFLKVALQEHVLELVGLIAQHMGTKILKADTAVMIDLLHGVFSAFEPRSVLDADESVILDRSRAKSAKANVFQMPVNEPSQFTVKPEVPLHASIQHIQTSKPPPRHPCPGLNLMAQSGENAFYVKTVPGTFGQVVMKNAARTKAATKVQAAVNAIHQPVLKTTNKQLLASVKVYTSQLLRGAFNALMSVARDEASLGINICNLPNKSMLRFFELSAWFMQYCRYQEEARAMELSKMKTEKRASASSLFQSTSSILSWKMIHAVLRVWLEMIDTDGKQKKDTDWKLQEASIKVLREVLSLLDLAFHYGSEQDQRAADILQRRLLEDDTKEAGVLNRISQCMRQFKKHDKRIARQEGRETRAYAVDMVKTLHVVLRVYSRLCKESFSVVHRLKPQRKKDVSTPTDTPDISKVDLNDENGCKKQLCDSDSPDQTNSEEMEQPEDDQKQERIQSGEAAQESLDEESSEKNADQIVSHRNVDFAAVLKSTSHTEILKLYMFLLEKYKALDASTLHAISTYLGRLSNEIGAEPMLYQISYLKQFHMILSDDSIKKRPMFNSLKKVASRIASHVIARLDPEPVSDPGLSSVGCDPSAVADQLEDGETPAPKLDRVLDCLPMDTRKATLNKIQDRVTKMLFVELLFEKGSRECEMIRDEYNWRKALLDRADEQNHRRNAPGDLDDDHHEDNNDGLGLPQRTRQSNISASSDEEDALPQPGAPKQVPRLPTKGLAAGLQITPEEQFRFKALFETVNGSRSAKQLFMAEWNQQEEMQMTAKQVSNTMAALNLRPGELTHAQEEKLSALVDEYGHLGRRSYKRIANAFPGGFSSAAIKRHMARLNLSLSSGSKRAQLEDLSDGEDGIMDQKEQLTNRKRSRDPASTRDADTHVQDDDISSGRDEYFASRPSAKKYRESTSMAREEGSQGPDLSAVNDIEDAVDVDGSRAKGEPELSDQDECGAMIPAKTADRGWHSTTSKGRKRVMETSTALGSKQTVRQDEACRKKKEKAKSVKSAQRSMVTSLSSRQPCDDAQVPEPAVKLNKGSGMNTTHSVSAFALRMDGMNAAAENMVLDLRKDGIENVTVADVFAVFGDMLAGCEVTQPDEDPEKVFLCLMPENDAEEHLLGLPSLQSMFDAMGLQTAPEDPASLVFLGSKDLCAEPDSRALQDYNDKAQPSSNLKVQALAGLLDDSDDDQSLPQAASTFGPKPKRQAALLSDDEDDFHHSTPKQPMEPPVALAHSHGSEQGLGHGLNQLPDACASPPVSGPIHKECIDSVSVARELISEEGQSNQHGLLNNEATAVPESACLKTAKDDCNPTSEPQESVFNPSMVCQTELAAGQTSVPVHAQDDLIASAGGPSAAGRDVDSGAILQTEGLLGTRNSNPISDIQTRPCTGANTYDGDTPMQTSATLSNQGPDSKGTAGPGEEEVVHCVLPVVAAETLAQPEQAQPSGGQLQMGSGCSVGNEESPECRHSGDGNDAIDLTPQLAPAASEEPRVGDAGATPDMTGSHSSLLRSRSATRSVTFSDLTTDLVSGPTHEWQGGRQRRREGAEEGQAPVVRLPRPALKPHSRIEGCGKVASGDRKPFENAEEGNAGEIPPSFGRSPADEAGHGMDEGQGRVPLSPIKINMMHGNGQVSSMQQVKPLISSALAVPSSGGKRGRTKKARLAAVRASQEASGKLEGDIAQECEQEGIGGQNVAVHKAGGTGTVATKALAARVINAP